ncbi:MAG: hypothetical protein ACRD8O_10840, partial [Bryobacteraceae bacterium]
LFGLSNDKRRYVSLSDGGHFENLGIYELVRRRCALIIACDAEEDAEQHFQGLGSAIRKCRTDFGVEIDVDIEPLRKLDSTRRSRAHCAVGTICYPETDPLTGRRITGTLFYVKSSLTGDEPEDVLEYESYQPAFPHQSTADQFFDESQFESYRRLGYHIAERNFHLLERIVELVEQSRSTDPGAQLDPALELDSLREAIRAPAG